MVNKYQRVRRIPILTLVQLLLRGWKIWQRFSQVCRNSPIVHGFVDVALSVGGEEVEVFAVFYEA